jgi:PAS domain S-box-containing protein
MNKRIWWTLLCLLLPLWTQLAAAQTGTVQVVNQESYKLSRAFTYVEDSSAQQTLSDILKSDTQARFQAVPQGVTSTNFGSTNSAIWLRVVVHTDATSPRHWMFEVAYPPLDRLDLYVIASDGKTAHYMGGDSLPFPSRAVPHRSHVLPIELEPGVISTLYLRIASQGAVSAPSTLWQPAALWQQDQATYSIFSLYFGLLIGLLLYNLLLFLSVRDPAYLIYVVFVACIGLSQAANSGLGAQFLWPDALWWNSNSINATHAASGSFGIWFVRSFLASKTSMPVMDRWIVGQMVLWFATFAGSLVLPYKIAGLIITGLAVVGVVTVLWAATLSVRQGHPGAKYFLLAWGAFLFGVVTQTMHNNGLLPSNPFTVDALLIGSALEMVLLSFALADRINAMRREKEVAQAQVRSEQTLVQALQQSQEHYRALIEHVGEGMVVVQDERIVFVNSRAADILALPKDAIIERGFIDNIHTDDRALLIDRVRRQVLGQSVPELCRVRLEVSGQPLKWLEFGGHMVPWDGSQGLLIFFLDVTQRHNADLEMHSALNRQQELNELRSRFVAMTSHEFRTPLATILSSQDLLKYYGDRLPAEEKQKVLASIEQSVHRMTRMLDRVLLLGKADAHMLEFAPQQINLRELCATLVTEAITQQPDSHCQVQTDIAEGLGMGLFDERLLRHIFGNLLSNAIKYSPDGGTVSLKVFTQGAQTVFEVSDQGIGVPPDEMDHLFASFHRASNVGSISGTGLGLAIVKQSVELHGGAITVRSVPGSGTTFTVTL